MFNIYFAIVFLVVFYENSDSIYIRYWTSGSVFNVRRLHSQRKVSSLVRELLYADDCDIVAYSEDELQCFMNHFVSACNSFGLKINLKKTVMYDPAPGSPYIVPIIFVEGNKLDVVHSFVYPSLRDAASTGKSPSALKGRLGLFQHLMNVCGPSMISSYIRKSLCIDYVFWRRSCMQAKLGHFINTNSNFWGFPSTVPEADTSYQMPFPCFRYRSIRERRATKHPVDGNEKLSPMGWSHCAYEWRPSAKAIILWWNVGRKEKCI